MKTLTKPFRIAKEIWFFARHFYLIGQELQGVAGNCKNCGWQAWKCFSEGPCCSGCDH
jgi:hypothetical protein